MLGSYRFSQFGALARMLDLGKYRRAEDAALLRSVDGELVALIANNARRSQNITIVSAGFVSAILMLHVPWLYVGMWWAFLAAALMLRTRVLIATHAATTLADDRKLRLTTTTFTLMALWQSLLMLFFAFVPMGIGAVLTMYLIGMCAGMVPSVAGHRRTVMIYCFIVMGAIACAWSLTPDPDRGPLERGMFLGMCLMFTKVLLDFADNAHRVFVQSCRIRMERVEINAQLSDALGQAEAASRAKTRFLASASHDLRQPIHALSLFAGSLLMRELDTRSADIAVQIDKAVRVLTSQLDALLDISRLDAGVVERSITTIDLKSLLGHLEEEFLPQAQRKGLQFELHCGDAMAVLTDPMLLRRVLGNLISNAIKYTDQGSVQVRAERAGRGYRVIVRDTGPGIPESEQEHVFEEFYQLGNPERDRVQGLGLGLAIVRRLSQLLHLQLQLRSAVGSGTEFVLELPRATLEEVPVIESETQMHARAPKLQVLVVDDEEDVRLGMQTLLEEMGFCVHVAASTEAAMASARHVAPGLVLADLRLRGDDTGLHTIQALRQVWPTLPAVLISGDTAPDRLREAHSAGVELLTKPVQARVLRDCILKATAT